MRRITHVEVTVVGPGGVPARSRVAHVKAKADGSGSPTSRSTLRRLCSNFSSIARRNRISRPSPA